MISFEEAQALKKGDVVFAGAYKCSVVKTKINKAAQTVSITYTDGSSDNFEGKNVNMSLTREVEQTNFPKLAEPPTPKIAPALGTADPMAQLAAGIDRNAQWSSLDIFEEGRVKIANAISEKLGIPISEFTDTPQTASFHFMTTALAIAKWMRKAAFDEMKMRDERIMNQYESLARSKVMAGALVRLFGHAYVQDLGQVNGFGQMISAFAQAGGVNEGSASLVFSAHTFVRQTALLMARHLADGSEGESPVSVETFTPYFNFLDNDKDEIMPRDAAMDASVQIYSTLKFLNNRILPLALEMMPEGEAQSHDWLRKYLSLAGVCYV